MRELPTIKAVACAPSEKIHKLWEGLGYYTRVRNLQKAAQQIISQHGGKFPEHYDEVIALPGIGRYTAGAICSIAFNQPTPILDGNVIRILTRIFGIAENTKEKETNSRLWKLAEELVTHAKAQGSQSKTFPAFAVSQALRENNSCSFLNQSLMEFGATHCTPRNPQCPTCPVKAFCAAFKEGRTEELPNLDKREAATSRRFMAFVIERDGKFLVRQRPVGIVNAHLWEFPNAEVGLNSDDPAEVFADLDTLRVANPRGVNLKRLCEVKHSITRYRITLEAFVVSLPKTQGKVSGKWKTKAQMQALAFCSAHKKVHEHLTSV